MFEATTKLIEKAISVAFGSSERNAKEIHDLCQETNKEFEAIKIKIAELESKAAKWDMIQWAIDKCVGFIEVGMGESWATELNRFDIERLEQLYKERDKL